MKEMIMVEKEVYEAVLRNSIKVNDLEAENEQLKKDIRYGLAVDGVVMEKMDKLKEENQHLKELLISSKDIIEWYSTESGYIDLPTKDLLTKIDNAIGEKK